MRHGYPRYPRIHDILFADDMPRGERGEFLLCHDCQRWVCWHGGFTAHLVQVIKRNAKLAVKNLDFERAVYMMDTLRNDTTG